MEFLRHSTEESSEQGERLGLYREFDFDQDSFYRIVNEEGYQDFLSTGKVKQFPDR